MGSSSHYQNYWEDSIPSKYWGDSTLPSMAGLYWDITLLAKVGKETATKTIRRQAILYSSSGLMFSKNKNNKVFWLKK